MKVVKSVIAPSAVLTVLLCASNAFGAFLDPAASGAPDSISLAAGSIIVSTAGTSVVDFGANQGAYTSAVYQETATGFLDFLYQFTPSTTTTPPSDLTSLTTMAYGTNLPPLSGGEAIQTAYLTSNAGISGTFTSAGTVAPVLSNYVGANGSVAFVFSPALTPGATSDILVIRTAATTYSTSTVVFQDSGQSHGYGYQPAPEPALVGVLLTSLFAAGLFLARRFQVSQN